MDLIENENNAWKNVDADAVSAISSGVESIANIFISRAESSRDAELQSRLSARDFQRESDRLKREAEKQQEETRQGFAIGAIKELRKSDQMALIRNIAIGAAIFSVLVIGIYYAGKK